MTIDMKKIIAILRTEGLRVLEPEKIITLCEILKTSIAYGLGSRNGQNDRNTKIIYTLPDGLSYRKQMWSHFKSCTSCMAQLKSLYRQEKTIDITIWSESSPENRRGVMKVEITLKVFQFKTSSSQIMDAHGRIEIE